MDNLRDDIIDISANLDTILLALADKIELKYHNEKKILLGQIRSLEQELTRTKDMVRSLEQHIDSLQIENNSQLVAQSLLSEDKVDISNKGFSIIPKF